MIQEGGSFRVMLVEDDESFRRILAELLMDRFPSIVLTEAADGAEALEQVENVAPQMIFMDVKLPGQNGLEVMRRIKATNPGIHVVILTSYDFPEYRHLAHSCGAQWFLSKGTCAADEIQNVVKSLWTRAKVSCTQCEWQRKEDKNGIEPFSKP